ncbi:MAG: hypothetical protein R3D03_03395 [Geminicoccaceae bacterium]|nr:hypothetical protein [Geminicoccaceae bacterium]
MGLFRIFAVLPLFTAAIFVAANAQAEGTAETFIAALRDATNIGPGLSYRSLENEQDTQDGIVRGLKLARRGATFEVDELRISGLVNDADGGIRSIDRLAMDGLDFNGPDDVRLTFHSLSIQQIDIEKLSTLVKGNFSIEALRMLDLGPVHALGGALQAGLLTLTSDRLAFNGMEDGRMLAFTVDRGMATNMEDRNRVSFQRFAISGFSIEQMARQMMLMRNRGEKRTFDIDAYREAIITGLPFNLQIDQLEIGLDKGHISIPKIMADSWLEGEHVMVGSGIIEQVTIDGLGNYADDTSSRSANTILDAPLTLHATTGFRSDLRTFSQSSEARLSADNLGRLDIDIEGTALDLVDAVAPNLPPSLLSRMVIDYVDRGAVRSVVNDIARSMGMEPQGLAFQIVTFARLMFPEGVPPRINDALRAIEDFIAAPGHLTIRANPPQPVSLDGMSASQFSLNQLGPLFEKFGIEVNASAQP